VTAAMSAVPAERSGLASGINNTARQTGTALGVAVFGAVAGSTANPDSFVHGMHVLAGLGAAVWLAVAVLVARSVRRPSPTSIRSG
jgi:MFS transporter, DHA2 family, methylenomycin A resistance protein